MAMESPMPRELLELVAERFKALGEPVRLQLLDALRRGEYTVGELADHTGLQPANVSKHLQILYQLGFVARRKEGLFIHYRLGDDRIVDLCDLMCGKLEEEAATRMRTLGR